LKRSLGPVALTALGIGAIIGAGIFAAIGTAISGDTGHLGAGSAIVVSIALAGVTSALAALTYSEFAALIPIAGSAYTYAYATLGELVAWIIGWDLILEYAVGNVAVVSQALELSKDVPVGLEDCLILSESLTAGASRLATFDRELAAAHPHCTTVERPASVSAVKSES
jgi:amino acid transporter